MSEWREQRAAEYDALAEAAEQTLAAVSDFAEACEAIGDDAAAVEAAGFAALLRSRRSDWREVARGLRVVDVPTPLPMSVTRTVRP